MSDSQSGGAGKPSPPAGPEPDGRGTHPGHAVPAGRGTHPGMDVTNAQALVLDSSIFECVEPPQLHAVKIIQLEYAHAVSIAAASAHEKLISELRRAAPPALRAPSFDDGKTAFA